MAKCKHQAGWYSDSVLMWGDAEGVYLTDSNYKQRRRRGRLVMTCNMPGCGAKRNVYFNLPLSVRVGEVKKPKSDVR